MNRDVRVLLVDDTPANLLALRAVLAGPELELVEAGSGAQALAFLLKNDCALILMDVQMPELDGYETAGLIRQNPRTRNIPIIFMTAYGLGDQHVLRGYASGAVDYLLKPWDPEVLRSKVAAFAALHRAQQQVLVQAEQLRLAEQREHAHALAELELRGLRREQGAQRRYRALVEGVTHAVVWIANPVSHAVTFASPSAREILGVEPEGWTSDPRPLEDRVHPGDREPLLAALRGLTSGDRGARVQHRVTRGDGEEIWLETALRLLPSERGEGDELHGFSVDVTEALHARDALRFLARVGEELGRSLDRTEIAATVARLAVPALAEGCAVTITSAEAGEPVVATAHADAPLEPAVRALADHGVLDRLGVADAPRVVDDAAGELHRLDPSCAPILERLRPRALLHVPLRARGRALGVVHLLSSTAAAPGARERALAVELGRRAAQAVENAALYLEAREAIRAREDFLSIASHELRTPLSALALQLELLGRLVSEPTPGDGPPPDLQRRVQLGARQVKRLTQLLDTLLDLSRVRSGKLELAYERFDACELLQEIAARFEESLATSGRRLSVEVEPVTGAWDRSRLDQVVTNLVSNAMRYGGPNVTLRAQARGAWAVLSVHDDGAGIPPDELRRMFGRYVQGRRARGGSGLGLGLYISRRIVEAHGGRLWAESAPGDGTTFTVELPCEPAAEAEAEPGAEPRSPQADAPAAQV